MVEIQFMTLTGDYRTLRTEEFADIGKATLAVQEHATSGGFTKVKSACDGDQIRFTATSPGGRAGRNIAYMVY